MNSIYVVKTNERRYTKKTSINNSLSLFISTGNKIGNRGATSLSKSLKSNTTLTELYLSCEDKRKKTHKRHQQFILSLIFTFTVNKIRKRGAISLNESLKSNTTLTKLNLGGENKRRHKRHPSTNHSSFLITPIGNSISDELEEAISSALRRNEVGKRIMESESGSE